MPNTVNFERHKLNQAMYQKLKRYIMSKRKRELEEKAQDDQFKKLRREREERKRQAELDAEDLEKTRAEISTTKKKIKELTARRNDLFQRWKQLSSEESTLKEKQRNETLTILANMPSGQFGINSSNLVASAKSQQVSASVSRSNTPAQFQSGSVPNSQTPKVSVQNLNLPQHHIPTHHSVPVSSRDVASPLRGSQNTSLQMATGKAAVSQLPTTISSVLSQLTSTTVSSSHAAAMAALSAVVATQRPGANTESIFPTTAAAAAYLNALASLNPSVSTSTHLSGGPLGAVITSSIGYTEAMAALAASGLYSLSPSNPSVAHSGNIGVPAHNLQYGQRNSPITSVSESIGFPRDMSSSQANAAMVNALTQLQSNNMAKALASGHRHNTGNDTSLNTLDPANLCLAQLANAVNSASAQQSQKLQQHQLSSFSAINPLLSPMLTGASLETLSTSTPTATTAVSGAGSSLPPAPIGYRGSITTGQSAQQIQLQQQQQQQQQQEAHLKQHLLAKYSLPADFIANRCGLSNQPGDTTMHANAISLANSTKTSLSADRLSEALIASIGVTNASSSLNAAVLQAGLASAAAAAAAAANTTSTSTSAGVTASSPVALTAVLAPYATDLTHLNYLNTATLAAAIQQQQQLQKMNATPNSSSPRTRASPAGSGSSSSTLNTSSQINTSVRRFF